MSSYELLHKLTFVTLDIMSQVIIIASRSNKKKETKPFQWSSLTA